MDKEGKFLIYCIERYRQIKGLTGPAVIELFNQYGVMEFIRQFHTLLHVTGDEAIVAEIDSHIREARESKQTLG